MNRCTNSLKRRTKKKIFLREIYRYIYLFDVYINTWVWALRMSFFTFFPPRLVAQTLTYIVRGYDVTWMIFFKWKVHNIRKSKKQFLSPLLPECKEIYTACPYLLNFKLKQPWRVQEMQNKSQLTQKQSKMSCAGCGRIFKRNEKTVSYDFERYYCFQCDDKRSIEQYF
jgi:hypothetical protein